jgi:hypothetical protein
MSIHIREEVAFIMSHRCLQLRQAAERAETERSDHEAEASTQARDRLTPVEDRLSRLLAKIASDVEDEGLSLAALQASLRGRWRGHAHPGELGAPFVLRPSCAASSIVDARSVTVPLGHNQRRPYRRKTKRRHNVSKGRE